MISKDELENLILIEKLSYEEIGRRIGMTGSGIKKMARKLGILLPARRVINPSEWKSFGHRKYANVIYPICGKSFMRRNKNQIYCSMKCSSEHLKGQTRIIKKRPVWDGIKKEYVGILSSCR